MYVGAEGQVQSGREGRVARAAAGMRPALAAGPGAMICVCLVTWADVGGTQQEWCACVRGRLAARLRLEPSAAAPC